MAFEVWAQDRGVSHRTLLGKPMEQGTYWKNSRKELMELTVGQVGRDQVMENLDFHQNFTTIAAFDGVLIICQVLC